MSFRQDIEPPTPPRTGLLLFACLALTAVAQQGVASDARPNIVFLLADDLAYRAIGPDGNTEVKTPNLDKLASDGVVFDRHYESTAICMAARASVMTGMYEYKTGCNFMHGSLTRDKFERSYPMLLKQAGYRIGFAGKFGFPVTDKPDSSDAENSYDRLPVADFDWWTGGIGQTSYETAKNKYIASYADRYPHSTLAYGQAASDFIRESAKSGRPFCLSVSFKAPHLPFTPDPRFDHIYDGITFSQPANYGRDAAVGLAEQAKWGRQWIGRLANMWEPDHYQETIRLYYQLIYGVDHAVGMIRAALEKEGVAGNTIIIFTSDNGYHMGAHGFGGKVLPYEEGSKVPLIIYDPRSPESQRGVRCESLTAGIDMAPTVLDYAGMAAPKEMDGGSLVPLVENPHRRVRDSLLLMNCWGSASTQTMAIVTERWKYLYWYFGDSMQPVEELFDLQADPGEVRNVAGELRNIDQLKLLRARYDEELARWSLETVPYNNYPVYGRLFDRSLTWDQKKDLVPKRYMDDYLFWVNFNKKKDQGQKKAADSEP